MMNQMLPVGDLLRNWRQHRRVTQLDLGLDADVSARHISFLETGRSKPSREMLLRLAEQLDIPLRERNTLLVAAGYAPIYSQTSIDDPAMDVARSAIDLVLSAHEPFPALAVDRHWTLVTANRALGTLLADVSAELLEPPVNVLRVSLHPSGLAPHIVNLAEWRSHVLSRLQRQVEATADAVLAALHEELSGYATQAANAEHGPLPAPQYGDLVIPIRLRTPAGVLSFFSTTTVFGAVNDITLSELAIESFYPADADTAEIMRSQG